MRCRRPARNTTPGAGDLLWVRYGQDPFWPCLLTEVCANEFHVEFIEADTVDYLVGTVSKNPVRWRTFADGLGSCQQGDDRQFRSWDRMKPLMAWVYHSHRDAMPPDLAECSTWQEAWCTTTQPAPPEAIGEVPAAPPHIRRIPCPAATQRIACQAANQALKAKALEEKDNKHGSRPDVQPSKKLKTSRQPVRDDLNNSYGAFLLCDKEHFKDNSHFEADPTGSKAFEALATAIEPHEYSVCKLTQSGSDGITHACIEACRGDISRCLFAAGTYVVGDHSTLRYFSTSGMNINAPDVTTSGMNINAQDAQGPAIYRGVLPTDDGVTEGCLRQVIALPYSMDPEAVNDHQLACEHKSLRHLTTRFALAQLQEKPMKALLLELVLASNGGRLSERFLEQLCDVCDTWKVNVVIDEVMTSVRCSGDILLAFTMGLTGRFSHAVIGKWLGIGAVLRTHTWESVDVVESRGETTIAATWGGAFSCVRFLNEQSREIHDVVDKRCELIRSTLVDTAKCALGRGRTEAEFWGRGCLLFSNVHAQTGAWSCQQDYQLTAGRYLPHLFSHSGAQELPRVQLPSTVKVRSQFREEQSEFLQQMFDGWLKAGGDLSGFVELELFASMRAKSQKPTPKPWTGHDTALNVEYPGEDNVFDESCLKEFCALPECQVVAMKSWLAKYRGMLYTTGRKGMNRHKFHFMLPLMVIIRRTFGHSPEAPTELHTLANIATLIY